MMVEEETMVLGLSSRRRYLNGDFEEEGGGWEGDGGGRDSDYRLEEEKVVVDFKK